MRWKAGVGFFLLLYFGVLLTGSPSHIGDSAKFQFLSTVWGTAHNPGYPLMVVLLHAWEWLLPFGTPALAANLLQVVLSLASLYFLWRVAESLGGKPLHIAAVVLVLATTRIFVRHSTTAEVYTFLLFLSSLGLYFLVVRGSRLVAWFLFALSLSHHPLAVVVLPFYLLLGRPRVKELPLILIFFVIAYLPYLLIIFFTKWPDALYVESRAGNLRELLSVIRGEGFRSHMDVLNAEANLKAFVRSLELMAKALSVSLLLLLFYLRYIGRRWVLASFLSLALVMAVGTLYHIPDIYDYFLMAIPPAVLLASASLNEGRLRKFTLPIILPVIALQAFLSFKKSMKEKVGNERIDGVWRSHLFSLDSVAVVSKNSYNYRQRLMYYTLGERLYTKGVYPIYFFNPKAVRRYLCTFTPYPDSMNAVLLHRANPPPGLEVIMVERDYERALKREGCSLENYGDGFLYRVRCDCSGVESSRHRP